MSEIDISNNICAGAVGAKKDVSQADTKQKNLFLSSFLHELNKKKSAIFSANRKDIKLLHGRDDSFVDRLLFNSSNFDNVCGGIEEIIKLPDPIGTYGNFNKRPSGISVGKMKVPLGVIFAIYESRPNVTVDIASLCIKSGNVVILRGGKESIETNFVIGSCIKNALVKSKLPAKSVQLIFDERREIIKHLIRKDEIDCAVVRGGRNLIDYVNKFATIPVLKHLNGNCHVYVDSHANLEMAESIILNAKTRRFGVCSAAESLLINKDIADLFLPVIAKSLISMNVEIRGCERTLKILPKSKKAVKSDWYTEYLAPIISIKIIDSLEDAIGHINHYGSSHTDAIVTDNKKSADKFLMLVDSSSVIWNASTAFADGGEYGLGGEVGISTGKFHVRGPVGLNGLTCEKYIIIGDGSTRS